jgi:CheY-like chemotaxis protein
MNLGINARDAMPSGGVLRIALRIGGRPPGDARPDESLTGDQYAILTVADTGTGIDPEVRPKIFEPFFTTKAVGQGTGLGLATVYGIVIQLNGAVRVSSEPGRGATFDIYVPLETDQPHEPLASRGAPTATDGAGRTVLLAEDEPGVRLLVERLLGEAGYNLIVAEDGASALEAARAYPGTIDLLVSDVVMPGLSGLELAVKLLEERSTMRVLLMSGYPQRAAEESAVLLDDVPFLSKPFLPADLLAAARDALVPR